MGDNFNENLKEARLKSGISQKDLAENIGVAKSTYSLYESGKENLMWIQSKDCFFSECICRYIARHR